MRRRRDLQGLLERLDPDAPLALRHLWLVELMEWIRGRGTAPLAAASRVQLLLDALAARPDAQARLAAWWSVLRETVDLTTLLADHGFAPRHAFVSEFADRLRQRLLPASPETPDASELFALALPVASDARWIAALDAPQRDAIAALLAPAALLTPTPPLAATAAAGPPAAAASGVATADAAGATPWQRALLDAIVYCAGQVLSSGFSPALRLRMSASARAAQPFHALLHDVEALRAAVLAPQPQPQALEAAVQQLRLRLDACHAAAATVFGHLEENGISVDIVFRLRQLRERLRRIRELLDCLLAGDRGAAAARLFARLVQVGAAQRSLRALLRDNSSLLAAKMAERSAETGEHYITRDTPAYRRMLRKAAGGGAITAVTVLGKYAIATLAFSAFWVGMAYSALYTVSFVAIQLLHCTLATKQPAMTAPALAARLHALEDGDDVEAFVDEVANLVRSQVAAVLGNVLTVAPCVLAASFIAQQLTGAPLLSAEAARYTLHSLSLWGPTALFAAFTGVQLFVSGLAGGWAENWFVLHRLDSALRFNPRVTRLLGGQRAARWAAFLRAEISGLASNVVLGLLFGLLPTVLAFLGVALDGRHVTIASGQLAAAAAHYGLAALSMPAFWLGVASIPVVGALNVVVSFTLAFRLALRSQEVGRAQRARIRQALLARWRRVPLSFFLPRRG